MRQNVTLTVFSLLSILLGIVHIADDVERGMAPGGLTNITVIVFSALVLYATLVLAGRRSGYIITLLTSLLLAGIPIIHMRGRGFGPASTRSDGIFFGFTLMALGTTALFTFVLAAQGLWNMRKGETR